MEGSDGTKLWAVGHPLTEWATLFSYLKCFLQLGKYRGVFVKELLGRVSVSHFLTQCREADGDFLRPLRILIFFHNKKISHWSNLPREVVESGALDTFKIWLDRLLGQLV